MLKWFILIGVFSYWIIRWTISSVLHIDLSKYLKWGVHESTYFKKFWRKIAYRYGKKLVLLLTFSASTSLPLEIKYFGLSGRNANAIVTRKAGMPQIATKILHELNLKPSTGLRPISSKGIIAQAEKNFKFWNQPVVILYILYVFWSRWNYFSFPAYLFQQLWCYQSSRM